MFASNPVSKIGEFTVIIFRFVSCFENVSAAIPLVHAAALTLVDS